VGNFPSVATASPGLAVSWERLLLITTHKLRRCLSVWAMHFSVKLRSSCCLVGVLGKHV
jgi:hypothetical protein